MSKKVVISVIAAVLVVGGVIFFASENSGEKTSNNGSSDSSIADDQSSASSSSSEATSANVITYSDNGFSPATLTVKSGDKVTVKNTSSGPLQFDSNPHPEHTEDPELNIGLIDPGKSATITVTNTGSHGYHNHLNSSDTGTLVVN